MASHLDHTTEAKDDKRQNKGGIIAIAIIALVGVVVLLFVSGFWRADVVKQGVMPAVSVESGALPKVELESKEIVVGTSKAQVIVPKIDTQTKTIDVPVIGVKYKENK